MRLPKRGEKGFTLIELLIVVAILGVLAAIVIPNVGRFIGRGEEEAKETEFANVQSAVVAMMTDNGLERLPNPVSGNRTNDMGLFPDTDSVAGTGDKQIGPTQAGATANYTGTDGDGYLLYQHDLYADNNATADLINYVATQKTAYWYTVDALGTVTQYETES
jgi:prepilin-type N-terminal cleavage/methylation domain-containing protein